MSRRGDFFENILEESQAYLQIEQLNSLVERGENLSLIPVQPLYVVLKQLPAQEAANYLHLLSKEQRKALCSFDLWHKDKLDIENFRYWLNCYNFCSDSNIKFEFAKSHEFCLFLKVFYLIHHFDIKEPNYPEHDNFFLTDDNLFLIEYSKDDSNADEVKKIISCLYAQLGVEGAYNFLFKLQSDSTLNLTEEEYEQQKEYLRDFGFVDYYEALDIDSPFPSFAMLNEFIEEREKLDSPISGSNANQVSSYSYLLPYKKASKSFRSELNQIESDERLQYLSFNFSRMVNAALSLENAHKAGSIAINSAGKRCLSIMELGYQYIKDYRGGLDNLFYYFDFVDLYRTGNTLIRRQQHYIKRKLTLHNLSGDSKKFLGQYWNDHLDLSFGHRSKVFDLEEYHKWEEKGKVLQNILPFIGKIHEDYDALISSGKIQSSYYINYTLETIDIEAILINIFAQHCLKIDSSTLKLGLSHDEFCKFSSLFIDEKGKFFNQDKFKKELKSLFKTLGLDDWESFYLYFESIFCLAMEGYKFSTLNSQDFKHIGGPIILVN